MVQPGGFGKADLSPCPPPPCAPSVCPPPGGGTAGSITATTVAGADAVCCGPVAFWSGVPAGGGVNGALGVSSSRPIGLSRSGCFCTAVTGRSLSGTTSRVMIGTWTGDGMKLNGDLCPAAKPELWISTVLPIKAVLNASAISWNFDELMLDTAYMTTKVARSSVVKSA